MRRRDFITLLGSAAAWPVTARAQQPERMRQVGVLIGAATSNLDAEPRIAAFRQEIQRLGWTDGRNIRVEYRVVVGGGPEIAQTYAAELVGLPSDIIVAGGSTTVSAVRRESRTIPVVFLNVPDPVGQGFVESLAHPSGNTTGFASVEFSFAGKWLEMLKEVAPRIKRVAILFNSGTEFLQPMETAARVFALERVELPYQDAAGLEPAISAFAREPDGGLVAVPDALSFGQRKQIAALAARYRVPAVYPFRAMVIDGGLMSYGTDLADLFRRSAGYVDQILRGTNPSDLPVQQPTKFELVINLRTAKALGLTIPPTLLALADEVIE